MGDLHGARAGIMLAFMLWACGDAPRSFSDARPLDAADIDAADIDAGDDAPAPVTSFAAAGGATGVELSWVNPADADLAGVLIVATTGAPATFTPVDGSTYAAGAEVATGEVVAHNALATSTTTPAIAAVQHHYAAWAYDAAGQYSAIATTTGATDSLGPQPAEIQVFLDGTVLVTSQPPALLLSGTATYDADGDALAVQLAVENQTGRILFNLKGLVESSSQGTLSNPTFPDGAGGLPMAYYGPAGLAIGAAPSRDLGLTGIDGTVDPVVLTMHFVDAPALVASRRADGIVADTAGSGQLGVITVPPQDCGRGQLRGGALSADAHYLFSGAKSTARIIQVDLTTLVATASATLTTVNGVGAIGDVERSSDGAHLYAVLHDGRHWKGGGATGGSCSGAGTGGGGTAGIALVELSATTLLEERRVRLGDGGSRSALAVIAGGRAVVTLDEGLAHVVDLATMTAVDTDPVVDGIQPLTLAASPYEELAVTEDGSRFTVAIADPTGVRLDTFDAATLAATTTTVATELGVRVVGLEYDEAGRLFVLMHRDAKGEVESRLVRIDGETQLPISISTDQSMSLATSPDRTRLYLSTRPGEGVGLTRIHDVATGAELDADGDAGNGLTGIGTGGWIGHHRCTLLTPF